MPPDGIYTNPKKNLTTEDGPTYLLDDDPTFTDSKSRRVESCEHIASSMNLK
jgi:hypothetical protein